MRVSRILFAFLFGVIATFAAAEDYPSRPVHLFVPYAGGGSGDLLARLLGEQLSKLWASRSSSKTNPAPAD